MNKIGWFILISSNKDELIIAAAVFFLDDSRTILYFKTFLFLNAFKFLNLHLIKY